MRREGDQRDVAIQRSRSGRGRRGGTPTPPRASAGDTGRSRRSGAGTGRGQEQGPRVEAVYETAESVRLKKYQLKESYHDQDQFTYEKAMQSIDETMKMLTESANKL